MVNMSKIKVGDTVTLRNGEVRTVAGVKIYNLVYSYSVLWQCPNNQTWHDYTEDGRWASWEEDPLDIVEHIPAKENNMIYVNDFKVGDTIVLRDGTTGTVEEISEYKKGFGLHLSCFPGKELGCYSHGRQKNFEESKYDIVEHIPAEEDVAVPKEDEEYKPSAEWMAKWGRKDEEPAQDEMTLRDQFAMAALSGRMAKDRKYPLYEDLARWSYEIADEMMKARKENN